MKILQSCGSHSWGGLEMQALTLAKALREGGHESAILCPPDSELREQSEAENLTVFPYFKPGLQRIAVTIQIKKLLSAQKYDIVHTHLSHDLWRLVPALHLAKHPSKLILTKHMGSSVKKTDPLHRYIYNRVDLILGISNYIVENVRRTCPVPPEKVSLLPNAIVPESYNPAEFDKAALRRELGIEEAALVIGILGRFTPMKGHREFFRAAQLIKDQATGPICFLVVGSASFGEEAYEQEIRKMVIDLDVTEETIFTGFQADSRKMLAVMDILAFPSHKESFGLTLLEAMAMEVPAVASNSGGVPDIVIDGETGILVPPQNAELLAKEIINMMKSPEQRRRFGTAGRRRVEERYSFKEYMKNLEKF
jgi:glycosyltransferase involved in cell wall biosynthesis